MMLEHILGIETKIGHVTFLRKKCYRTEPQGIILKWKCIAMCVHSVSVSRHSDIKKLGKITGKMKGNIIKRPSLWIFME